MRFLEVAVVAQGGGLGAPHALDPNEIGLRDLAECDGSVASALGRRSTLGQLALNLPDEPVLRDDRRVLVEMARLRPAAPASGLAVLDRIGR